MSPVPWCGDQILSVAAHFSSKKLDEWILDAAQHCRTLLCKNHLQAGPHTFCVAYQLKTNIMLPLPYTNSPLHVGIKYV